MEYENEVAKPKQPKQGSPDGMYNARVAEAFNGEMMSIAYGKYGKEGCSKDASRIAPYMMYNDNADQNGY